MDADKLRELASEKPLSHPLPFVVRYIKHDHSPPEHLREMMGSVFRGMSPRYPGAAKKIARLYPREHGKSQTGTVDVPVWAICRNPNVRVLIMSETSEQAKNKLRKVTDTLKSIDYDHPRIVEDNKKSLTVEREANHDVPTVQSAGFDTGVTGGHYDLIIFDDVVSWKTQRTQARRDKAWRQFSDYQQNLGAEGESVFLALGTRKHPKDLYNDLINSIGWNTRVEPALSDWSIIENREFRLITEDGKEYDGSEMGEINPREETVSRVVPKRDVDVLWESRWSLEKLLQNYVESISRGNEGTLIWKRENQNDPDALQGQILGESMISFEDTLPDEDNLAWYAGVDLGVEKDAAKAAANDTDYWSVTVGGHHYDTGITYLIDVRRRRGMSLEKGIAWVRAKLQPYPVRKTLVESNQAQRWFVQTAQDKGLRVERTSSSESKEERIIDMSSRFESGKVRLYDPPSDRPGGTSDKWRGFIDEWAAFPTGDHDDRLDSTEIMLRAIGKENIDYSSRDMGDLPV